MSIIIKGDNRGIAVDGDLTIEHLDFQLGQGVKSVTEVGSETFPEAEVVVDAPTTTRPNFAFMKHWGHSEEELAAAMESLRVRCQGNNSRSVMRFLVDLDKEGFIDISEVKAAELYEELCRSFGMPNIKKNTFSEAFRVMG